MMRTPIFCLLAVVLTGCASAQTATNVPPKESIQEMTRRLAPGGITKDEAIQIANAAYRVFTIARPKQCLPCALTLPTSVAVVRIDSTDVLAQDLEIMPDFKPLDDGQLRELVKRSRR